MSDVLAWPDDRSRWWWMHYKPSKRARRRVVLVELIDHDGTEFVQPWQDRNAYSAGVLSDWDARFIEAPKPPSVEDFALQEVSS